MDATVVAGGLVLLSDRDIRVMLECGLLSITPLDMKMIQPASVDLRLANQFRRFGYARMTRPIRPEEFQSDLTDLIELDDNYEFILKPGEFALGSTTEVVTLPTGIAGRLDGKSSLGRLGLMVHSTAGFIDPGFSGQITLELSNVTMHSIALRPGMPIGQLSFMALRTPSSAPYGSDKFGSRYQNQRGPTPSKSYS